MMGAAGHPLGGRFLPLLAGSTNPVALITPPKDGTYEQQEKLNTVTF
jgi:hypothetical protein